MFTVWRPSRRQVQASLALGAMLCVLLWLTRPEQDIEMLRLSSASGPQVVVPNGEAGTVQPALHIKAAPFIDPEAEESRSAAESVRQSPPSVLHVHISSGGSFGPGVPARAQLEIFERSRDEDHAVDAGVLDEFHVIGPRVESARLLELPTKAECRVPAEGWYDLIASMEGVFNNVEWMQHTKGTTPLIAIPIAAELMLTVEESSDHPITLVRARANGQGGEIRNATRDEVGRWCIKGPLILPIAVEFQFADPGFPPYTVVARAPEEHINLTGFITAAVRVEDADTKLGIARAAVRNNMLVDLHMASSRATAGTDGVALITLPRAVMQGTRVQYLRLHVTAPGYGQAVVQAAGQSLDAAIVVPLLRAGRPGGRLLDEHANPLANTAVYLSSPTATILHGRTDAEGRFTLQPGRVLVGAVGTDAAPTSSGPIGTTLYVVTARGEKGLIPCVSWAELVDGTWTGVCIWRMVEVELRDRDTQAPVRGAPIQLVPRHGRFVLRHLATGRPEVTNTAGRARFSVLQGALWSVQTEVEGRADKLVLPIEFGANAVETVFVDTKAVIALRFVDEERAPVGGVGVALESGPGQRLVGATNADGRVAFQVVADRKYRVSTLDSRRRMGTDKSSECEASDNEREFTLWRIRSLDLRLSGPASGDPDRALIALLTAKCPTTSRLWLWERTSTIIDATEEATEIRIYAPGARPVIMPIAPPPTTGPDVLRAHLPDGHRVSGTLGARFDVAALAPRLTYLMKSHADAALGAHASRPFALNDFQGTAEIGRDGSFSCGPLASGTYVFRIVTRNGEVALEHDVAVMQDLQLGVIE